MIVCLENKRVKARKKHSCWLCGYEIDPGTIYIRSACVDEGCGQFSHAADHVECHDMTRAVKDFDWENTEPYWFLEQMVNMWTPVQQPPNLYSSRLW